MAGNNFWAHNYIPKKPDPSSEPTEPPDDLVFEGQVPVIAETQTTQAHDDPEDEISEAQERMRIQNMSDEETMRYLAQSLNEINMFDSPDEGGSDLGDLDNISWLSAITQTTDPQSTLDPQALLAAAAHDLPTVDKSPKQLTVEPFWGDIYIKASRNLRELCENGKLTMAQIETELKEKLLEAAEQFAAVTKDESKIPKSLLPKITELKAAVANTDPYFQVGEDIAVRAMFFMLYQMLSYADRIAETPETKEKLNDFFRRFGAAGISLSMLDVRV